MPFPKEHNVFILLVEECHPNVRLTKPLMREALLTMLSMCLFQKSELVMVIPKLHTVLTLFRGIVWCDMSEICLKLKVLAKIDFIVFYDFIRGQIS